MLHTTPTIPHTIFDLQKNGFRKDNDDTCQNVKYIDKDGPFRHPNKYSYLQKYGRCKFGGYRRFSHEMNKNKETFDASKKQLENIKQERAHKDDEIRKNLDQKKIMENLMDKIKACEKEKRNLRKL